MPSTIRPSLLALGLLLALGCAALPPAKREPRDPWERMNRATYRFNDKFDRAIFQPAARGYRKVTPRFVQTGVSNFFDNLEYPVVMANDLLQGQFRPFVSDTGRLLLNTTVGVGGLMDPATRVGLDKNDRDFGQTLGKWGVGTGPYLVIPILGPSDARDALGRVGDEYSNPRHYVRNAYVDYGLALLRAIDTRTRLLEAQGAINSAYDPYAFVRNIYLQHRAFKVNGGQSSEEEQQEQKLLEESEQDQRTPQGTSAPPH
ncbi:MAG: VacJ family lipoprotein [Gammaproteobacteria bacterium]|nr:MAG: VacJ family lipoprotein [Gammaproteobacteria bacterium]